MRTSFVYVWNKSHSLQGFRGDFPDESDTLYCWEVCASWWFSPGQPERITRIRHQNYHTPERFWCLVNRHLGRDKRRATCKHSVPIITFAVSSESPEPWVKNVTSNHNQRVPGVCVCVLTALEEVLHQRPWSHQNSRHPSPALILQQHRTTTLHQLRIEDYLQT